MSRHDRLDVSHKAPRSLRCTTTLSVDVIPKLGAAETAPEDLDDWSAAGVVVAAGAEVHDGEEDDDANGHELQEVLGPALAADD